MSGKVRYIFAMRTPLKETKNNFVMDEEGNIIENNELNSDNANNDSGLNSNANNMENVDEKEGLKLLKKAQKSDKYTFNEDFLRNWV